MDYLKQLDKEITVLKRQCSKAKAKYDAARTASKEAQRIYINHEKRYNQLLAARNNIQTQQKKLVESLGIINKDQNHEQQS